MRCRLWLWSLGALLSLATPLAAQKLMVGAKLEDLQAAALRDSTDPVAHYNLGMGFWSKKRYAEADSALRRAIAIDPEFADAHLALALVHSQDDDFMKELKRARGDTGFKSWVKENQHDYRRAFMLDPLVDIKVLGATMYFSNRFRFNLIRAMQDLVEGSYEKAYIEFDHDLGFWGGQPGGEAAPSAFLWLHALAAAHSDHFDAASHDLDVMLARAGKASAADSADNSELQTSELRYMKASFLLRSGHPDLAVPVFLEVAQGDIGNYMAHVQLARIYESQRDYDHALIERTNALNANPDDASLMLDRGITLGKSGNMAEAETQLEQALEANPRDVRILFWLGVAQAEQGKKDKARDSFNAFLARAPSRYDRQIAMAHDRLAKLQ